MSFCNYYNFLLNNQEKQYEMTKFCELIFKLIVYSINLLSMIPFNSKEMLLKGADWTPIKMYVVIVYNDIIQSVRIEFVMILNKKSLQQNAKMDMNNAQSDSQISIHVIDRVSQCDQFSQYKQQKQQQIQQQSCKQAIKQLQASLDRHIIQHISNVILQQMSGDIFNGGRGRLADISQQQVIMTLLAQYNHAAQYYRMHSYKLQLQHNRQLHTQIQAHKNEVRNINDIQSLQMEKTINKYTSQLNNLKRNHQVEISTLSNQHWILQDNLNDLQQIIANKNQQIQQLGHKMSSIQAKIQKYQFAAHEKNKQIEAIWGEIATGVAYLQGVTDTFDHKYKTVLEEIVAHIDGYAQIIAKYENTIQQQTQIIDILYSKRDSNQENSPIKWFQLQQKLQNTCQQQIKQFMEFQSQTQQLTEKFLLSIPQSISQIVNKLLIHNKNQKISYDNLSHKYAQFLKETEHKLHDYRQKCSTYDKLIFSKNEQISNMTSLTQIKDGQLDKLNKKIRQLIKQADEKDKQLIRMLQLINQSKIKQQMLVQQSGKKVCQLQQQLDNRNQKIAELQHSCRQQAVQFDKHINMLTLEIQSLKQAISTLKNVVPLDDKESNKDKQDGAILQQMIDKTYEIRLQNSRMKDRIQQLVQTAEKLRSQIEKQAELIANLQQQIEMQQKAHKQALIEQKTKTQQQQQKYNNLQKKHEQLIKIFHALQQQYGQTMTKIAIMQQRMAFPSFGMDYEKMEILRLEIFVLNQIVSKYHHACTSQSTEVQVDMPDIHQQQHNTALTIRHTNTNKNCNININGDSRCRRRTSNQSIGRLVQITKVKQPESIQNNAPTELQQLNKTCKLRTNQQTSSNGLKNQIVQLNELLNYMVNYLKGYTRNGVRPNSWLTSHGQPYVQQINTTHNLKVKYANFQKIRALTQRNQKCRQLVKDYEAIANYYFKHIEQTQREENKLTDTVSIGGWDSYHKKNVEYMATTHVKNKMLDSLYLNTK